jgi:hypothetical protein
MGYLDKVRHFLESSIPDQDSNNSKMKNNVEVEASVKKKTTTDFCAGDEIERMVALGAQLQRGEISAIRCGLTGKRCTACKGVPCLGSEPWEDD